MTPLKIQVSLLAKRDDPSLINTGDQERDAEIRSRAKQGEVWACAHVTVEARLEIDGQVFVAESHLRGARYDSAADFMTGILFEGMKDRAIKAIWEEAEAANRRGRAAITALMAKERRQLEIVLTEKNVE